ncbi:unnamed protein product [Dicrocoelium dendriticum]|nr:unnamed protein product [Dicrocoelium dendriticum]
MNIYALSTSSSMMDDTAANMGPSGEVISDVPRTFARSVLPTGELLSILNDRIDLTGNRIPTVQQIDELSRMVSTTLSGGNIPGPSARRLLHMQGHQHQQPPQPQQPQLRQQQQSDETVYQPPPSLTTEQSHLRRLSEGVPVTADSGQFGSDHHLAVVSSAGSRPRNSPSAVSVPAGPSESLGVDAVDEFARSNMPSQCASGSRSHHGSTTVSTFAKNVRGMFLILTLVSF